MSVNDIPANGFGALDALCVVGLMLYVVLVVLCLIRVGRRLAQGADHRDLPDESVADLEARTDAGAATGRDPFWPPPTAALLGVLLACLLWVAAGCAPAPCPLAAPRAPGAAAVWVVAAVPQRGAIVRGIDGHQPDGGKRP